MGSRYARTQVFYNDKIRILLMDLCVNGMGRGVWNGYKYAQMWNITHDTTAYAKFNKKPIVHAVFFYVFVCNTIY